MPWVLYLRHRVGVSVVRQEVGDYTSQLMSASSYVSYSGAPGTVNTWSTRGNPITAATLGVFSLAMKSGVRLFHCSFTPSPHCGTV